MATKLPATQKKKIGELLIEAEIITPEQLQEALAVQKKEGGKVVELLISLGHLDSGKVAQFLAAQPGVPSIDLTNYRVTPDVVKLVDREFATRNELFPIDRMGKLLTVGMAFPLDSVTIKKLEEKTGLRVKALLCNTADIRKAIEHYYVSCPGNSDSAQMQAEQITAGARVESIATLIRQIDALPTLPQTVLQVREAAASLETGAKEIATIVSRDPAIAATLLKLANSAAYGVRHRVDNLWLATSFLGVKETVLAVTSAAIISLTEGSKGFDHETFWRRSTLCAGISKKIGEACGLKKVPGLFTAGLLCEIGRFALCQAAPERYAKISEGLSDAELSQAEERAFGISHSEAGYLLADHWGLPPELAEPIRYHLAPDQAQACPELTAVVALAARCVDAQLRGENAGPEVFDGCGVAMARLGVNIDTLISVYESL